MLSRSDQSSSKRNSNDDVTLYDDDSYDANILVGRSNIESVVDDSDDVVSN